MMQLDPSSSSISTPTNPIPSEQTLQVEVITYMDSDLFKAAEDGDMEFFDKYQGGLHSLVDGMQNTALHIYSRSGGRQVVKNDKQFLFFQKRRFERVFSINFVEQLVDKCPSLLLQPNAKGEIPLHLAAKQGHSDIVKFLIERAKEVQHEDVEKGLEATRMKQMLRKTDKDGNTALHNAVECGDLVVVRLLVKELDPDFSFSANASGETPLFIAAKAKRNLLVAEILDNWKSTDYGGRDGGTALHAAVIVEDEELVKKLIEANKHLTQKTDNKGWTPLHYAAHHCFRSIAKLLLKTDASAAYITDKQRGMTALHLAACQGEKAIMKDIISCCPGCCEIVDKKGWNFLHFAVITLSAQQLETLLFGDKNKTKNLPIKNLVREKDVTGITPFHVLFFAPYGFADLAFSKIFFRLKRHTSEKFHYSASFLETQGQVQKLLKDIVNDAKEAGESLHPSFRDNVEFKLIPDPEIMEKVRESHLVVATLIATVTFAAAFTIPGGYESDEQGKATLIRDSAFQAFIISDTLAFVSSLSAVFLHFVAALLQTVIRPKSQGKLIIGADLLTTLATCAMIVVFCTGLYPVIKSFKQLAIATLFLGLGIYSLVIIIFWQVVPLFNHSRELYMA